MKRSYGSDQGQRAGCADQERFVWRAGTPARPALNERRTRRAPTAVNVVALNLLLCVSIGVLMCGGCAIPPRGPASETPRRIGGAAAGQPVTSAELDEL